jgi:uncharacterized protein involved in outer membrane biogenesis
MKIRKLIIISPLGLVLLVGLFMAWWFLGDDAWIKGKIEDTVSEMTGRSLSIDGAFSIDWSAKPILVAEDIHFSNPPWAINPDLARLDKLEVSIDLFSLFKDQKRINYIAVNGLVIALEEHESGENSWEILSGQEEPAPEEPAPEEPPAELPVSIDQITLTDFSLLHHAPDRTVPFDFRIEQLELDHNADQQVQFITDGWFGGVQFDAKGNLGPLNEIVARGKTNHNIRLNMGEIVLQSQGRFEQLSTLAGANVNLTFSGPEFEWILTQLAVPPFSHGDFDFRLDLQTEADQTILDLAGDLGSLEAHAKGSLGFPIATRTAELTADVFGDDLGTLLEVVGLDGSPRNPFHLTADISHASGVYQLQTLMLEAGNNTASISGHLGDWPELLDTELDISVTGPDLRSWLGILPVEVLPEADYDLNGRLNRVGSQPVSTDMQLRLGNSHLQLSGSLGTLPSMTGADLAITAEGPVDGVLVQLLGLADIPGKDLNLSAKIERDAAYLYLNEVSFEVADNHLEVTGKVGKWPELKGTDLNFSLEGSDLSVWSNILNLDGLPAGEFSLRGQVSPSTTGLALDAIRLEVGSSYFTVNGNIGEPPGFAGTALSVDAAGPSLAAFQSLPGLTGAPAVPFSIKGKVDMGDPGLTFDDFKLVLGHNSLNLDGLLGLNDQWEGSSFQSQLIVPNIARLGPLLGVEGLPEKRLSVNGSFQSVPDGWAFQLADGTFAGASFESQGKYIEQNGAQKIEAMSQLSAPSLAQLGLVAGVETLPDQPVDIKGFVHYSTGRTEVRDIKGTVGDSLFELSALLVNPPTWSGSEVTVSASGQDIGQLLVNRYFEEALPFSLDGSISRDEQAIKVSQVKARLGLLQVSANGIIGNLDNLSATDLQLAITAPSLQNIGEFLDFPMPDDPFQLRTRFQGSPSVFRAGKLELKLGPSDLSGEMSIDLSGKPSVNGVFKSNYLDLAWLQNQDKDTGTGGKPKETSQQDHFIPDTPITLPGLEIADSDIEITVNKIDFLHRTSRDIHIHSRVKNGNLYLDPFQTRGEDGGLLSGNLAVEREDKSDITNVVLSLEGDNVQLGIGQFEGQDPETFREADIVANLAGAGATYRDLARSLNGHIEVVQGPGLTTNSGLGLIFGNFIGELLNLINPFAKTDKFTVNECAVAVVNIESGVITVEPVVSQTKKMTLVAKGVVDLHTEKIQFAFNTKLRKGIGISASMVVNPFVSITGTLKSPIIGLDPAALAVKGTVAVATVGISLLARSLADRFLSSKDPCGDALKKSRKNLEDSKKKEKK